MDVILGVGDWLSVALAEFPDDHQGTAELAALVALASRAQQQVELELPPSALVSVLTGPSSALPLQLAHIDPGSSFGQWMAVAATAEHLGYVRLAQLLVDSIRMTLESIAVRGAAADPMIAEYCAICWCRRGRISRIAGQLEDARGFYLQACALLPQRSWLDARALAELGLCAVAADHGNFPEIVRRASRLLRQEPMPAAPHRFAAHHFLALAQRRRGRLVDALLHGWAAFDLVPVGDVRRPELLITLAEIALALGDLEAAEHGFATVAQGASVPRVRVSAIVGAIQAQVRRLGSGDRGRDAVALLRVRMTTLAALIGGALAPRDEARALLALADAHEALHERKLATVCTAAAASIAARYQLYELQFRADTGVHRLQDHSADASVSPKSATRHPAVSRLFQEVLD